VCSRLYCLLFFFFFFFFFFLSFNLLIGWQLSIWNCCKPFFSLLYNCQLLCFWRLGYTTHFYVNTLWLSCSDEIALTTYFSELIPVVKRRISVLAHIVLSWMSSAFVQMWAVGFFFSRETPDGMAVNIFCKNFFRVWNTFVTQDLLCLLESINSWFITRKMFYVRLKECYFAWNILVHTAITLRCRRVKWKWKICHVTLLLLRQDTQFICGPGSSVGIATGYGLDGPGIESRLGAKFSAPVQTGPGAHPASCKMGTGSFPGVKRLGRDADPSPPSSAEV
jgi:hypothetical protein